MDIAVTDADGGAAPTAISADLTGDAGALAAGAPGGPVGEAALPAGPPAPAAEVALDLDDIELTTNAPVPSADPESEPAQTQDDDDPTDEPVDAGVAPSAAPPAAQVTPARTVKEALAQIKLGQRDAALTGLRALWKQNPKSATIPYLLGNLYHDRRWWTVSMEHYQAAIKRDRSYRSNATLNRNVIDALTSPKTRGKASWFLRTIIGAPARRYLKPAARSHKSASVRRAAAYLLKKI
ncbi:MAG: hypothetical protein IPL61_28410 [Myxococcales bacterium]|nr:hypothetical protein [Myxococcales bacterium]